MKEFWERYRAAIIGGAVGLFLGILFLTIGFFPTLLLVLLIAAGAIIGGLEQVREAIKNWFFHLFQK